MLGEELISTGIGEVDELLGGGVLQSGLLLIDYNKLSMGWTLGIKIAKNILQRGGRLIVFNTVVPVKKLKKRAEYLWLDLDEAGRTGNLAIIDLFGSKCDMKSEESYVYTIDDWDDELVIQKMGLILKGIYDKLAPSEQPVVSLFATVDGAYHTLGKSLTKRLMIGTLRASGMAHEGRTFQILLLNRDAVDPAFETFLTIISDQVIMIDRVGVEDGIIEHITVPKSLVPGFVPRMKAHKIKMG